MGKAERRSCSRLLLILSALSHQGSPQQICFQSPVVPVLCILPRHIHGSTSAMSSFITSINLLFGLPFSSFLATPSSASVSQYNHHLSSVGACPYHLSLASRVFSPTYPSCAVPLMYSFLILSIIVTPTENRNIFNSATSASAYCIFVNATVSNPYTIASLTATLYTIVISLIFSWYLVIKLSLGP